MPQAQRSTLTSSEAASFSIASRAASFETLNEPPTKRFDAHIAEQDVGIGHRRLRAAALIGGRARKRAGRARTDIEQAKRILGRDGSAARADLDHLDRLDLERKAGSLAEALVVRDFEVGADGRLAVRDQAELGGGAAHVKGQHARLARRSAELGGGDRAGRRTRFNQTHRQFGGAQARNEAAGRGHPEHLPVDALVGEFALQMGDVRRPSAGGYRH